MRLWHKDLLDVLPRQQLLGQWRECCAIAKNISEKGTPGHVLVNRIMEYPDEHFNRYAEMVNGEMLMRGYKSDMDKFIRYRGLRWTPHTSNYPLFKDWHNDRYLRQNLYNLQEKRDCRAISEDEWDKITQKYPGFKDKYPW